MDRYDMEISITFSDNVPEAFRWQEKILCSIRWWWIDLFRFWSFFYEYRFPVDKEYINIPKEVFLYIAIKGLWIRKKTRWSECIFTRSIEWYDEYFWIKNEWGNYNLNIDKLFKWIKETQKRITIKKE